MSIADRRNLSFSGYIQFSKPPERLAFEFSVASNATSDERDAAAFRSLMKAAEQARADLDYFMVDGREMQSIEASDRRRATARACDLILKNAENIKGKRAAPNPAIDPYKRGNEWILFRLESYRDALIAQIGLSPGDPDYTAIAQSHSEALSVLSGRPDTFSEFYYVSMIIEYDNRDTEQCFGAFDRTGRFIKLVGTPPSFSADHEGRNAVVKMFLVINGRKSPWALRDLSPSLLATLRNGDGG
ncbi:hypothetical protein [Burkholderia anthina]|uniref:hypothetical protein n=1 Tax=Burkholderia anthina TaxID=179879 RepID=UPI00158DFFE8|nr:hypothetical protein [Burkholderia anthina]